MSTKDAKKILKMSESHITRYAKKLGIKPKFATHKLRTGGSVEHKVYDLTADDLGTIFLKRTEIRENARALRVIRNSTPANRQRLVLATRRKQHSALLREDFDYYGRVKAYRIAPATIVDRELSSETGPQMKTLQWEAFYPPVVLGENDESTAAWAIPKRFLSWESIREKELKRGKDRF